MKNMITISLLCLTGFAAIAQDPLVSKQKELSALQAELKSKQGEIDAVKAEIKALSPVIHWKKGAFTSLNFNTVGLNNWAAGGVQSNAITALGNVYANYNKDKVSWVNNLDVAYGLLKNKGESFRKNEDKMDYLSKLGYRASNKLNYAMLVNFKSQFAPAFDDVTLENPVEISKFLAPAYINASFGLDYKLLPFLSIYFSPAAGKFTIVNDDSIAARNIYIPDVTDAQGKQYYNDNFRAEFGLFFNALLDMNLTKSIGLKSRLDLFNNWTDKNELNRKNVDVNWETMVNMKLTKYIGASLFTHLIYDNDIDVPTDFDPLTKEAIAWGPRLQFKHVFGIGFSYKF